MGNSNENTPPAPIKSHLDLWVGILLGVGVAASLSAGQKLMTLGFTLSTLEEIEGRAYFALTAAVLVVTHIYRQEFLRWNKTFVKSQVLISLPLFGLAIWAKQQGFWESKALAHLSIIVPFSFLLFSLLVYAESLFTRDLREKKLIPPNHYQSAHDGSSFAAICGPNDFPAQPCLFDCLPCPVVV